MSQNIDQRIYDLVDEYSLDGTGWARFSDDRKMRFRLGRTLAPHLTYSAHAEPGVTPNVLWNNEPWRDEFGLLRRVVFVMCNPSTADAFKLDPTVGRCVRFAQAWGAHVLEVVNLYALRSPYPQDLDHALARGEPIGTNAGADVEIMDACLGAHRVIAAWGNNGARLDRWKRVKDMLAGAGVKLEHLGMTGGPTPQPLHPLARGKHHIPIDREPQPWA